MANVKRVKGYAVWKKTAEGRISIDNVYTGEFAARDRRLELIQQGFQASMEPFYMNEGEGWPQPRVWAT